MELPVTRRLKKKGQISRMEEHGARTGYPMLQQVKSVKPVPLLELASLVRGPLMNEISFHSGEKRI